MFYLGYYFTVMNSPVEQIKSRLDVLSVVQSYIKLDRAGANFRASCPFHNEKNPSFFVSPAREIWHCFSCNKGGDIFSFVMEIEGVEFPEALKILAQRAGVELGRTDPRLKNEKIRLLDLIEEAADFYEKELLKHEDVLDYLEGRGLEDKTIKMFKVGFASGPPSAGWRNTYDFLRRKGYSDSEIEKAGLVIKSTQPQAASHKPQTNYYDRFRNRIMFPVSDGSGRIVGFSGRVFGPEKEGMGKYINSPQTVLYDKSRVLYGFDKAKFDIRKKNYCVLVEGQMDILMSHQAGVTNAVAVSGTALTSSHINILKRLTSNASLAFDKDEAGFAAAKRGIELLLKNGFEVKIIPISSGKDPADVIKNDSKEWIECLKNSEHVIDFYLNFLREKFSDGRSFRKEVETHIIPYFVFFQSEIERSFWVSRIAKALNIQEEPVWQEIKKASRDMAVRGGVLAGSKPAGTESKSQESRAEILENRLIGLIFMLPDITGEGKKNSDSRKEFLKIIKGNIEFFSDQNKNILDKFLGKKAPEEHYYKKLALEAETIYSGSSLEDILKEVNILSADLKQEKIKDRLKTLAGEIRRFEGEGDQKKLTAVAKKFNDLSKQLKVTAH